MPKSLSPETSPSTLYPEQRKRIRELTIVLILILYVLYTAIPPHAALASFDDTPDPDHLVYFEPLRCDELEALVADVQTRDPQVAKIIRLLEDEGLKTGDIAHTIDTLCDSSPNKPVDTAETLSLSTIEQDVVSHTLLTLNTVTLETEEQPHLDALTPEQMREEPGYALVYPFEVRQSANQQGIELPELDALLGQFEDTADVYQALSDVKHFLERYSAQAGTYQLLIVVNQTDDEQTDIAFAIETAQTQIGGLDFLDGSIIFVGADNTPHWAIPDGQHFERLAIVPLAEIRDELRQHFTLSLPDGNDFVLVGLDNTGHIVYVVSQDTGIPLQPLAEVSTTGRVNMRALPGTDQPIVEAFLPGNSLEPASFAAVRADLEAQGTPQALDVLGDLEEKAEYNTAVVHRGNYDWYPLRAENDVIVWVAHVNTISIEVGATPEAPAAFAQPVQAQTETASIDAADETNQESVGTQETIQNELNTWPLPDAYGAYLLNCEVVNTWQSWGAELDNGVIAAYFADVRYITPNGEEVIFSVPLGMSNPRDDDRYDNLLYGSSIPATSVPLDSRFAAGTLEDSGLTPGDIVRLTIGNPTEEDSAFMRAIDGIQIAPDNLQAFAETGDLSLLPLRNITNARYDMPIFIALHFEIVEDR